MAGALDLEMAERATGKLLMATTRDQNPWQWNVQYARCFTFPTSYLSKITATATTNTTTSTPPTSPSPSTSLLSPITRKFFKQVWISSSGLSTVSLHPSADRYILTVILQGTVMEEHFISKLQFVWPQVSCLSGFPTRGSLVVLVSYTDSLDEKQKFAMRFSGGSEAHNFMTSLEDILSNRFPSELPAVDASEISSQSEFVPPYRPDTSNVMAPIDDFSIPEFLHNEDQQAEIQDSVSDSQSNPDAYPPRFSSLVSSCSAEHEQGKLALSLAPGQQDFDLKAQISKYMQDASFLDMVNKVNEVITELGGDFEI